MNLRNRIYLCVALLGGVLLSSGCTSSLWLYQSPKAIRADLLKITPLGTSFEKCADSIPKRIKPNTFYKWDQCPELPKKGVPYQANVFIQEKWPLGVIPNGKGIGCELGLLIDLWTIVCADWGFDKNGKLIDISVWTHFNSL